MPRTPLPALLLFVLLLADPARSEPLAVALVTLDSLPASEAATAGTARPDMLPDGVVSQGANAIRAAWLIGPTDRYDHGVLGDAIEASGLAVETAEGETLTLTLGPAAVFEDRIPRLVDLDGDGRDEVLLVKSGRAAGASLALAALRDGELAIVAEGEPIGRAYRWLNPVGTGDFDGDGRIEVAHVETPHIGGTLVISRLEQDRLVAIHRVWGFSNHRMGSPELGLSTVLDVDGDGRPELIVPDESRRRLRVVGFAGGRFEDLADIALGAEVTSALQVIEAESDGRPRIAFRLADGRAAALVFER
jgi:hypothetical protein